MQVAELGRDHPLIGRRCTGPCNGKLRPGHVVLWHRTPGQPFDVRDVAIHARCARALLTDAPAETRTPDAFEQTRERMLATRQVFTHA